MIARAVIFGSYALDGLAAVYDGFRLAIGRDLRDCGTGTAGATETHDLCFTGREK